MIPRTWWDTVFQPLKWLRKLDNQCLMPWQHKWTSKLVDSASIWLISQTHGDYYVLCPSFHYLLRFSTFSFSDGLQSHFYTLHSSSYSYVAQQCPTFAGTIARTLIRKLINISIQLLVLLLLEFSHYCMSFSYAANGKTLLLELASWEPLESSLQWIQESLFFHQLLICLAFQFSCGLFTPIFSFTVWEPLHSRIKICLPPWSHLNKRILFSGYSSSVFSGWLHSSLQFNNSLLHALLASGITQDRDLIQLKPRIQLMSVKVLSGLSDTI